MTTMTPEQRIVFTREAIRRLTSETDGGERWVFDAKTPGLGLRIRSGVAAFYVYRRVRGHPAKIKLGDTDAITIEQARKLAAVTNGQIAAGLDPREQRRIDRANSATLGDILDHFIENHGKLHKRSWEEDEAMVKRYLADWKRRRLAVISKEDIEALHRHVGKEHGIYAANRLLALISAACSKAGNLWKGENVAAGVTRFAEKKRRRFLQRDELPRFLKALRNEPNETIRDYLLILLLTGARRSTAAAMEWSELDLERGVWQVPGEKMKGGEAVVIPLCEPAVRLLLHRKKSDESNWVFPTSGTKRSKSGHVEQFKDCWKGILNRAEIADLRLHDLRRSLGSWLTIGGASLPIVGAVLGHRSEQATKSYAWLSVEPQSAAVNLATKAMLEQAPAKLLPSPSRRRGKR